MISNIFVKNDVYRVISIDFVRTQSKYILEVVEVFVNGIVIESGTRYKVGGGTIDECYENMYANLYTIKSKSLLPPKNG